MKLLLPSTYTHNQAVAAIEWNITHNLNRVPFVQVIVNGSVIIPKSTYIVDSNNIKITFSSAKTGYVILK